MANTTFRLSNEPTTKEWIRFFEDSGLPPKVSETYAKVFSSQRIKTDMLKDLNERYLQMMDIVVIGDIIAILRHAKNVCEQISKLNDMKDSSTSVPKTKPVKEPKELKSKKKMNVVVVKQDESTSFRSESDDDSNDVSEDPTPVVVYDKSSQVSRPPKRKLVVVKDEGTSREPPRRAPSSTVTSSGKVRQVVLPPSENEVPLPAKKTIPVQKKSVFSRLGEETEPTKSTSFTITNNYGNDLNTKYEVKQTKPENVFSRLGSKSINVVEPYSSHSDVEDEAMEVDQLEEVDEDGEEEVEEEEVAEESEEEEEEYVEEPQSFGNVRKQIPNRVAPPKDSLQYQGILKRPSVKQNIPAVPLKKPSTMRADQEQRPSTSYRVLQKVNRPTVKKRIVAPASKSPPVSTEGILGNSQKMRNVKERLGTPYVGSIVLGTRKKLSEPARTQQEPSTNVSATTKRARQTIVFNESQNSTELSPPSNTRIATSQQFRYEGNQQFNQPSTSGYAQRPNNIKDRLGRTGSIVLGTAKGNPNFRKSDQIQNNMVMRKKIVYNQSADEEYESQQQSNYDNYYGTDVYVDEAEANLIGLSANKKVHFGAVTRTIYEPEQLQKFTYRDNGQLVSNQRPSGGSYVLKTKTNIYNKKPC